MYIEIENTDLETNNFPNKNRLGQHWFTVVQNALIFREGEKYPDKFELNLYFQSHDIEDNNQEGFNAQKSIVAIKPGKYQFDDRAFYVTNRNQLALDPARLKAT